MIYMLALERVADALGALDARYREELAGRHDPFGTLDARRRAVETLDALRQVTGPGFELECGRGTWPHEAGRSPATLAALIDVGALVAELGHFEDGARRQANATFQIQGYSLAPRGGADEFWRSAAPATDEDRHISLLAVGDVTTYRSSQSYPGGVDTFRVTRVR